MKLVEYGKLNNTQEPTSSREPAAIREFKSKILLSQKAEKLLFSGVMMGAGLISLLAGAPTDSIIYAALIPAIWYDNYGDVNHSESDTESDTEHDVSDTESESHSSAEIPDIDAIMEKNLLIKMQIIRLAQQLCKLSGPRDMGDYKKDSTYDDMIYHFSKIIPKTSYLKTQQALKDLDPRLYLKIVNKESELEDEPTPDQVIIPVRVRDSAWIGWPSANTQIIDIDDIAHFYCLD